MRTIIHIGQHKTGTTSLQHFLRQNRQALRMQGLYVPEILVGFDNPSHFILNVYSLSEARSSSMKDKLKASKTPKFFSELGNRLETDIAHHYEQAGAEGCRDVLWSNEGLYLLNSEAEYRKLADLFRPYSSEIVAVCCFRDARSYRASYTSQLARQKISPSGEKDSYRYIDSDSWLFDYARKKWLLSQVFDNALYFQYDSRDNIAPFLNVIGHRVSGPTECRLNVSAAKPTRSG